MKYLKVCYVLLGLGIAIALYILAIPIRLDRVRAAVPTPQAIFVLGGGQDREVAAAQMAHQYPELDVWISTGSPPEVVSKIFTDAGIPLSRLKLDYRASDTVTNFTTMAERFEQQQIEHVYLVTSDFHMRRARAISFFVFGSKGIVCTPIETLSNKDKESSLRALRDVVRSLIWSLVDRIEI